MFMETLSDMKPMYIEQILYIVYTPLHLGQALIEVLLVLVFDIQFRSTCAELFLRVMFESR